MRRPCKLKINQVPGLDGHLFESSEGTLCKVRASPPKEDFVLRNSIPGKESRSGSGTFGFQLLCQSSEKCWVFMSKAGAGYT